MGTRPHVAIPQVVRTDARKAFAHVHPAALATPCMSGAKLPVAQIASHDGDKTAMRAQVGGRGLRGGGRGFDLEPGHGYGSHTP